MATEIEKIKQELATAKAEKATAVAELENVKKERDDALDLLGKTPSSDAESQLAEATLLIEDLTKKLAIKEAIGGEEKPTFEIEGVTHVINVPKLMVRLNGETVEISAEELATNEKYIDVRAELVAKKVGVISEVKVSE